MQLTTVFINSNKKDLAIYLNEKEQHLSIIQHSYIDVILNIPEMYKDIGPFAAFISSFSESFFPIMPLIGLIIANAASFGIVKGLIFSWLGSTLGTLCLYLFFRYYRNTSFLQVAAKKQSITRLSNVIKNNETFFLLIAFTIPFFPRFFVTFLAGINQLNIKLFLLCISLGNLLLFTLLSIIGDNFYSIFTDPFKLLPLLLIFIFLAVAGKKILKSN